MPDSTEVQPESVPFTAAEADLLRQWFNAVEDVAPKFLELADYELAIKLARLLGTREPKVPDRLKAAKA